MRELGLSARMGLLGRSRAARMAVEPLEVLLEGLGQIVESEVESPAGHRAVEVAVGAQEEGDSQGRSVEIEHPPERPA